MIREITSTRIEVERTEWRHEGDTFTSEREIGTRSVSVYRRGRLVGRLEADDPRAAAMILISAQLREDAQVRMRRQGSL